MGATLQFLVELLPQRLFDLSPKLGLESFPQFSLNSRSKFVLGRCKRLRTNPFNVGVAASAADWPKRIRDLQFLDHEGYATAT